MADFLLLISSRGRDATAAYITQDPNATSSGNRSAYSSRATNVLNDYYIGDLSQTVSQDKVTQVSSTAKAATKKVDNYGNEYEEDDDQSNVQSGKNLG